MLREGGAVARADVGATGTRTVVPAGGLFLGASTMRSFLRPPGAFFPETASASRGEDGAAFVFTKRCSFASYTIEESWLRERVPPLPSRIVREVRTGAVAATRPLASASRGGDFRVSHFWPAAADSVADITFLPDSAEKTPCSRFSGVLPPLSSGCMGTTPSLPFWRTKTAVVAR
jgi:hypothetical protein